MVLWSRRQPRQGPGHGGSSGPTRCHLKKPTNTLKSLWTAEHVGGRVQCARDIHHPGRSGGQKTLRHLLALPWVDDWGILEVKDSGGNVVAQVDLKENPQTAGEQGGHKYHTGDRRRSSPPAPTAGKSARPTSTTIRQAATPPSATTASTWCRRKPGQERTRNRVPARETRATTAAERRLPIAGRVGP